MLALLSASTGSIPAVFVLAATLDEGHTQPWHHAVLQRELMGAESLPRGEKLLQHPGTPEMPTRGHAAQLALRLARADPQRQP
jgi:hypothetical protein